MFTPQEKRLIPFLFRDLGNKEISNEMGLDARTISTHQRNILEKVSEFMQFPIRTRIGLVLAYYSDSSVAAKLKPYLGIEV